MPSCAYGPLLEKGGEDAGDGVYVRGRVEQNGVKAGYLEVRITHPSAEFQVEH